ncbi:MAG: hypothetical protein CL936_14375 [Deltaproteobacteria bacterium]|nr:hypothetical protein [Deltaproteobacteria bacterium]
MAGFLLISCLGLATACTTSGYSANNPLRRSQLWQFYQKLPSPRAFALSGDPKHVWIAGVAGGVSTQTEAVDLAIADCERLRRKRRMTAQCRVYAENETIVWWGRPETEDQSTKNSVESP